MYGWYKVPPFIAALTAATCWIAVTLTPCPKAVVANSTGPTLSNENKIPLPSPFRSIPVFSPKPKFSIYLNKVSFPILLPNSTNPGLLGATKRFKKNISTHYLIFKKSSNYFLIF